MAESSTGPVTDPGLEESMKPSLPLDPLGATEAKLEFEIWRSDILQKKTETSNTAENLTWAKEFSKCNEDGTVVLQGRQLVRKRERHPYRVCRCVDMLIYFQSRMNYVDEAKLIEYLEDKISPAPRLSIPHFVETSWKYAVIMGQNDEKINCAAVGLKEFFHRLMDPNSEKGNDETSPGTTDISPPAVNDDPNACPELKENGVQPDYNASQPLKEAEKLKPPAENNTSTASGTDSVSEEQPENTGSKTAFPLSYLPNESEDHICGIKRKYYGVKSDKKGKVILLLGASGSGKTTLVNFIANNFKENTSVDRPLIQVTDGGNKNKTPTRTITAYTFCASQNDSPITVIDTPGLNDSSGEKVKGHVLSLETFLANCDLEKFEIHAIGFVAPAHLVRLTSAERLVINYLSTLFAEGYMNHMITLVTFADGQEKPPVVEAMKMCGVTCRYLKFNNSTLSCKRTDEIGDLDRAYWRIGYKNWTRCVKAVLEMSALTVNTMKSLQHEAKSTRLTEYTKRNLTLELENFISQAKDYSWFTNKKAVKACESAWNLAAALTCLGSSEPTSAKEVNSTLVEFTKEVCKSNGHDAGWYIRLLSLAPSRSLVQSGIEILKSLEPLYRQAQSNEAPDKEITPKNTYTLAYCRLCNNDHKLTWVKSRLYGAKQKCNDCECDIHYHHPKQQVDYPMELLKHTKQRVDEAGQRLSIPGYPIYFTSYLTFLEWATQGKYYNFINDVMRA